MPTVGICMDPSFMTINDFAVPQMRDKTGGSGYRGVQSTPQRYQRQSP